ncbi:Poly [ADP-ribose] polymerase [Mycena indigotica]|uniref:Poly [ADP-ribose] polymerase n=1 Tax=Mycena indigotica TaxID=2126181 RepID=A0A8H6SY28_9AGAR|nr:Poly [ADP-ribose] polymerase [Mycena indigotica]KAF7306447.1 Poly [ADP-ribose] polymerase [Mycena indigotica]
MPPRKKAAADGAAPAPTRSSTRTKSAAASAPAPAATKPKSKKRAAASDDEDSQSDNDVKKPASKKAKKAPASKAKAKADSDDENSQSDNDTKKPASKKAKKAPASKAKAKAASDDDDKPAKMVTVLKRGRAPVDSGSGKVNTHQVFSNDEGVWDAMLNQTNIGNNNNKFYVLQLLHPVGNDTSCILFTRWGRVGADGQTQVKGPFPSSTAIREFKKQFKAKASVEWEDRVGMVPKAGKYTWLERDYGDEDEAEAEDKAENSSKKKGKAKSEIPPSKLDPEIQELCNLIFSTSIIDATLSSMNYDANKLPLGKLAKSTVLNGFAALKALSEVINDPNGDAAKELGGLAKACEHLSGRYYSIIPHDFGFSRPVSINTKQLLEKELELVDALSDMEIASKLIAENNKADEDADGNPINPMDKNFHSLNLTSMEPVQRTSSEWGVLEAYVRDTHGHTHGHIQGKVLNAFRVERAAETAAWNAAGYDKLGEGERLLLWHGSRSTNFTGILSQGLRIAPPEAPVTGYMFGKGVYFADMMSKSAGYCYSHLSNGTGVMLLCEIAAKPFHELVSADYHADQGCKKNKKRATKGLGRSQPGDWKDAGQALGHDELIGCHMPEGPAKNVDLPGLNGGYGLQYNEYIVYSTAQIRVRYLLMVKM